MKIVKREDFLKMEKPIIYLKCDKYGNPQNGLSICQESYENDFSTLELHGFIKAWSGTKSCKDCEEDLKILKDAMNNKDKHFEWDYSMSGRDGLYEKNQMFMVYEKLDILKLIRELNKLYDYKYHKDDYSCKYEIY